MGQHLSPLVLAILLETIERVNFDEVPNLRTHKIVLWIMLLCEYISICCVVGDIN